MKVGYICIYLLSITPAIGTVHVGLWQYCWSFVSIQMSRDRGKCMIFREYLIAFSGTNK